MRSFQRPDHWKTRAQVWLGTLVEVALPASASSESSFSAAFDAVAHVHRCMNPQDPMSDLGRIERDAHRGGVVVDASTYFVLQAARRLAAETASFDPTVARRASSGARSPRSLRRDAGGRIGALTLCGDLRVVASEPVVLDLGGIAKGYAVDRAVDSLRCVGASAGLVNAGGDLRVFGAGTWQLIRVRHPDQPSLSVPLVELREAAAATTGDYFRSGSSNLIDPRSRAARAVRGSITVTAPTCMMADALTKVVGLDPAGAVPVLARHGAHGFRLDLGRHGLRCLTSWRDDSANLRRPNVPAA